MDAATHRDANLTRLTCHAEERMWARSITAIAVDAALIYGRVAHVRGAEIHALGRKEVEFLASEGIDLGRYEGVQVVCSAEGTIITVYRNSDFRGLRPRHCRRRAA